MAHWPSKWTILFFLLLVNVCVYAQPKEYFHFPKSLPKPRWFDQLDWKNINVFRNDSIIHKFQEENRLESPNEKESSEEPYLEAYKRWRISVQPYIKSDGSLDFTFKKKSTTSNKTRADKLSVNAGNWTFLGPNETYGTGKIKGNEQANIYTLSIDPNNPNILYCGAEDGIIFKSLDKGLNWSSVSDGITLGAGTAIGISKQTPNTVYANAGQLIKSSDGGTTWISLTSYTGGGTEDVEVNPSTDRVYVASLYGNNVQTINGIYTSDDGGRSWNIAKGTNGTQIYDIKVSPITNTIVYAVGADSNNKLVLLRSIDGGTNFTNTTGSLSMTNSGARLGVTSADGKVAYCIVLTDTEPVLLKSTTTGSNWIIKTVATGTGLGGNGNTTGLGMSNGQGFYDLDIVVSTQNADQLIVGACSAYKSIDGGNNFVPLGGYNGTVPIHPDIQSMRTMGNDTYIATDGGVNYSSDFFSISGTTLATPSNYDVRNKGLSASNFWGFGQGWGQDLIVGGRYHNGNTALFENYGSGNALLLGGGESATGHVFPGYDRIAAFNDIGTYVMPSTLQDDKSSAGFSNTKWPNDNWYGEFKSRLMTDYKYRNIFYVGENTSLWKSINSGISYLPLHTFPSTVWRFDISRSNPDTLFVCTTNGIYRTSDGGNTWTNIASQIGTTYAYYDSDIVIDPSNANTIFLAMAQGGNTEKVFKSTDGGNTWTNYTGANLTSAPIAYLQADGTNGGIYAITNDNPSKVFYRDNTMSDWINFSNGLPDNIQAWSGALIFFRDDKIRIAGNRGVWESPLYKHPAPIAQPMSDKQVVGCSSDIISFNDYSILNYNGVNLNPTKPASWHWTLPGATYVNGTTNTSQKPQVTYNTPGSYTVTLTVTDGLGLSSTRMVANMIQALPSMCTSDPFAGSALNVNGNTTIVNIGTVDINSNNFTISCWIKPNGVQGSFSQLIAHDPYPGSSYGFGLGFPFNGYTPSLNLCYTDNTVNYSNNSNLVADNGQWNFVVLTYAPTGVTIYLNGAGQVVNNQSMPVIDLSQSPFYINKDIHNQGGAFKGQIDEVKFYNYALSQTEVREKMHLIPNSSAGESGLIKYYQFNKYDPSIGSVYDIISGFAASVPTGSITVSTAPIATGTSYLLSGVSNNGPFALGSTSVSLTFNSSQYPNGDIVSYQLNGSPYGLSPTINTADSYWIIRYWGTKPFDGLNSMSFQNMPVSINNASNPSIFSLYDRPANSFDKRWIPLCSANTATPGKTSGSINYGNACSITTFNQQFIIPIIGDITGATNISVGCSTTLNNTSLGGIWTSSNPNVATVSSSGTITGISIGSATIVYTVISNDITLTTAVVVNVIDVIANSAATITASGPTTFCKGGAVTLMANSASSYLWSDGETTQDIVVTTAGNYSVTTTTTCGGNSKSSANVTIVINASPDIPVISADWLMLSSSSNDNNQWYFQGSPIAGATAKNYQATGIGQYTVMTTNANGCSAASSPYTISSLDLPTDDDFIIYPNPSHGLFHINKPGNVQIIEIRVFDLFAHLVYQSKTGSTDINLSGFDPGIYFVELTTPYKTYKARKVIIQ